jgi:hypothetical protein
LHEIQVYKLKQVTQFYEHEVQSFAYESKNVPSRHKLYFGIWAELSFGIIRISFPVFDNAKFEPCWSKLRVNVNCRSLFYILRFDCELEFTVQAITFPPFIYAPKYAPFYENCNYFDEFVFVIFCTNVGIPPIW